jgi:DNA-binding SARP family transcriptional activator
MEPTIHLPSAEPLTARSRSFAIRLFGGFELRCDGALVDVAPTAQRVLAFLALHDRPLPRAYVAEALWPDTTGAKAAANLRTALWRLPGCGDDLVSVAHSQLALAGSVWVDVRVVVDAAAQRRRTNDVAPPTELVDIARGELLPGCWDSWLVFDRERLRAEVIHLLEALGHGALAHGDTHVGVLAGLAAVECDPLRESANALLIQACVDAGDRHGAVRAYERYQTTLAEELGIRPEEDVERIVRAAWA